MVFIILCCIIAVIVGSVIVQNADAVHAAAAGVVDPGNSAIAVGLALAAGGVIYTVRHRENP